MATPSLVSTYKSHFTTTEQPATSPYDIQLNTAAPPFNNVKARQAIYYATDAAIIDQKLFGNQFQVVQGFTAPGGLFYYPNVPGYPTYDLNKAKPLVKQIGGLNVNFFTLASPVNQNFMEALQTLWKQAGINTSIHLYSLAGLIQQFVSKKWQAALQTAGAWDPAAGVGLGFRFLSAVAVQRRARPEARRADPRRPGRGRPDRPRQDLPAGRAVHRQERRRAVPVPARFLERRSTRRPGPGADHGDPVGRGQHAAAVAGRVVHAVRCAAQGIATDE